MGSKPGKSNPGDAARPREAVSTEQFKADFDFWAETDPRVAARLLRIIEETLQTPFTGIGKPEALRHTRRGQWSRRLTWSDRVLYRVTEATVVFLSARGHY